jgi:HK97 family phage prohead protease
VTRSGGSASVRVSQAALAGQAPSAAVTLAGHASVFNEWTKVSSVREGEFLERVEPGAFANTIRSRRDQVRVLFNHGHDPYIGSKPLGPLAELREDSVGLFYQVPLLDAEYTRQLVPALRAGLLGASFRFSVTRDRFVESPGRSAHNPHALPERSLVEVELFELGPVTFGAYPSASAGIAQQPPVAQAASSAPRRRHPRPRMPAAWRAPSPAPKLPRAWKAA